MAVEGGQVSKEMCGMDVLADSAARKRAIGTVLAGAMLGLLFGITVMAFLVSAPERGAAATGAGRGAGLVDPSLFEAPVEHGPAPTDAGRGAGLVDPSLFEAPVERE